MQEAQPYVRMLQKIQSLFVDKPSFATALRSSSAVARTLPPSAVLGEQRISLARSL